MVKYYIFFAVLFLATITSIIVAFSVVGNPMEQKDIQLDTAKLTAITNIQNSINSYIYDAKALPGSLEELKAKNSYAEIIDPETKTTFTYQKVSNTEYKLCTNFKADSTKVAQSSPYLMRIGSTDKLTYKKGFDCISKTVVLPAPTPTPFIPMPPAELKTDEGYILQVNLDKTNPRGLYLGIDKGNGSGPVYVLTDFTKLQSPPSSLDELVQQLRTGRQVKINYFLEPTSSVGYITNITFLN